MPSRGSGEATAVDSTTVSPVVTSAAPDACLAMRPVSKTRRLPPASSTVTSCLDIESSFRFCRLENVWEKSAWEGDVQPGEGQGGRLGKKRGAREGVGFAPRSRFSSPDYESRRRACIQPMAVRRPWQRFEVAR